MRDWMPTKVNEIEKISNIESVGIEKIQMTENWIESSSLGVRLLIMTLMN